VQVAFGSAKMLSLGVGAQICHSNRQLRVFFRFDKWAMKKGPNFLLTLVRAISYCPCVNRVCSCSTAFASS
jgi:hypothetical protein